ncbi:MAG TPA: glycosyltransferase family 2 protein [Vicinamibacterales bacterium]|nr:glycosyltransferase family 2 protein [Vicinamibacterales bacterium]
MRLLFWGSALFIAYVYVGYAVLLTLWARVRRVGPAEAGPHDRLAGPHDRFAGPHDYSRGPQDRLAGQPDLPSVSIIIAARNEGRRLPARIDNLLSLGYPADRLQIIVVSDGSSDNTPAALAPFGARVCLIEIPPAGKAVALNAGVARATGEVLVFADARQTFADDALHALVAPLSDPRVGGVSGELILGAEGQAGRRSHGDRRGEDDGDVEWMAHNRRTTERRLTSSVGDGVGFYWKYEKHLRQLESEVGSMLGATGAIYALRRSLWRPLPPGTILDDVLAPMRAVLAGRRIVFEPQAQAFDATSVDAGAESRRKIRTLAGNVQILWFEPRLLVPFLNPVWLQYASHKIGRLLVPYALMILFASSIVLSEQSLVYGFALFCQAAFYLHGGYGAWLEHRQSVVPSRRSLVQRTGAMAFTVVVMNVAAVAGAGAALLGRKVWR